MADGSGVVGMESTCLNTQYRNQCEVTCTQGYLMEKTPWSASAATFYTLPMEYTCALDETNSTDWSILPML